MQIHELQSLSGNPSTGTYVAVDTGTTTRKLDYNVLAKSIVENYAGSTLGGSARSVQAAINAQKTDLDALKTVLSGMEVRKLFSSAGIISVKAVAGDVSGLRILGTATQDSTPTPTSPVDIGIPGSSGTLTMVASGKNLLHVDHTAQGNGTQIYTEARNSDGELVSLTLNGAHGYNGTVNVQISQRNANTYRTVLPVGIYIFTVGATLPTGVSLEVGRSVNADGSGGFRSYATSTTGTLTFENDKPYGLTVQVRVNTGVTLNNLVLYPMIRISTDTDSTFEPFKGTIPSLTLTNGLPGIPVASGGNYTDVKGQQWICDEIDLDHGVYIQRVAVETFNGGNNCGWQSMPTASTESTLTLTPTYNYINSGGIHAYYLSSRFICRATSVANLQEGECAFSVSVKLVNILNTFGITSVADAKTWFASNPVTMVYALATPVETALTSTQITALQAIKSHEVSTSIWANDLWQPNVDARMFVDLSDYV